MDFKSLTDPVIIVGDDEKKPSFFNKIRPPKTNFGKIAGPVLTVFLLFAVGIGVYITQKPTNIVPHAEEVRPGPYKTATPSASLKP